MSEAPTAAAAVAPRRRQVLVLAACCGLIVLGLGLRLWRLSADPPAWEYVFNTDEGHYSYNANQRLRRGVWFPDEARYALITPLFSWLQFAAGWPLAGMHGVAPCRAVSALAGVLSCAAMAALVPAGSLRLAAAALASCCFMGIVHSRLGIPETLLTLFVQGTVLLAWQGWERRSRLLSLLAGVCAAGCVAVKPSGVLAPAVLALAWLLEARRPGMWRLGGHVLAGLALGGALYAAVVVTPYPAAWWDLMEKATSFGRASIEWTPGGMSSALGRLVLSPALRTLPLLWPFSLAWAALVFVPRWHRGQQSALDTLLFAWLVAGVAMLGLPSYQPGRWQVVLFPAVIAAGLRFLLDNPDRRTLQVGLGVAVLLAAVGPWLVGTDYPDQGPGMDPARGALSHLVPAGVLVASFCLGWAAGLWAFPGSRAGLACAVVAVELAMQGMLNAVHLVPMYRPNQWTAIAAEAERLAARGPAVFSGDLAQDLSLRANVRTLPMYYVLRRVDDASVREFFLRQGARPTHFLLMDIQHGEWQSGAPRFSGSLRRVGVWTLHVGGLGQRAVGLYRVASYGWLPAEATPD